MFQYVLPLQEKLYIFLYHFWFSLQNLFVLIKVFCLLLENFILLQPSLLENLMYSRNLFKKVTPGKKEQIFQQNNPPAASGDSLWKLFREHQRYRTNYFDLFNSFIYTNICFVCFDLVKAGKNNRFFFQKFQVVVESVSNICPRLCFVS